LKHSPRILSKEPSLEFPAGPHLNWRLTQLQSHTVQFSIKRRHSMHFHSHTLQPNKIKNAVCSWTLQLGV